MLALLVYVVLLLVIAPALLYGIAWFPGYYAKRRGKVFGARRS